MNINELLSLVMLRLSEEKNSKAFTSPVKSIEIKDDEVTIYYGLGCLTITADRIGKNIEHTEIYPWDEDLS
jgi:hypothetical protein